MFVYNFSVFTIKTWTHNNGKNCGTRKNGVLI
ncbi:hypothetical protein Zm00014a_016091 [Zea mays]|uniref:Uncharacterized protein n=1 Tax=Zea mays TaxID=4577 RepID=A0A3L6G029_MAIZE|nr:hypothetical protein Zm00014a_016091 [Zea mays]